MRPELKALLEKHKKGKEKPKEEPKEKPGSEEPMGETLMGQTTRQVQMDIPPEAARSLETELASVERALDEAAAEVEAEDEPDAAESEDVDVSGMFRTIMDETPNQEPVMDLGAGEDSLDLSLGEDEEPATRESDEEMVSQITNQVLASLKQNLGEMVRSLVEPLSQAVEELKAQVAKLPTKDDVETMISENNGTFGEAVEAEIEEKLEPIRAEAGKGTDASELSGLVHDAVRKEVEPLTNAVDKDVTELKAQVAELPTKADVETMISENNEAFGEAVDAELEEKLKPIRDDVAEAKQIAGNVRKALGLQMAEELKPVRADVDALKLAVHGDGSEEKPGLVREYEAAEQLLDAQHEALEKSCGPLVPDEEGRLRYEAADGVEELRLEVTLRKLVPALLEGNLNGLGKDGNQTVTTMLQELVADPTPIVRELARAKGVSLSQLKVNNPRAVQIREEIESQTKVAVANAKAMLEGGA